MKKRIIIVFALFIGLNLSAQRTINDYKYVVVPAQYGFLGEDDKYQLNSLTKFLFNKYGYSAFMEGDEYPMDLLENGCLAMYANLLNERSLFKTKVQLELKDCNGTVIQQSKVGETKEKLYNKAFNLALREAFETFQYADYQYLPKQKNITGKKVQQIEVEANLETEVEAELETAVEAEIENLKESKEESFENVFTPDILEAKVQKQEVKTEKTPKTIVSDLLYAQPIQNGFQVVDTEPKKVMILYTTGLKDVFIVDGKNAVVYKKDGEWYYDEYAGNLNSKKLNIKF